jgi:hypothetical protein
LGKLPVEKKKRSNQTVICFAYESDLEQMYAFYCARYENIKYDDFMKLGFEEFSMKLASIPESEPLFKIIKSRTINLSKIKDKEERKYWRELKRINAIPDIYKSNEEIEQQLKTMIKNNGGLL